MFSTGERGRNMRDVAVIGVGMTKFSKYIGTSLKDLGREACLAALKDAGISHREIQVGYCGNAVAGVMTGQTMVVDGGDAML